MGSAVLALALVCLLSPAQTRQIGSSERGARFRNIGVQNVPEQFKDHSAGRSYRGTDDDRLKSNLLAYGDTLYPYGKQSTEFWRPLTHVAEVKLNKRKRTARFEESLGNTASQDRQDASQDSLSLKLNQIPDSSSSADMKTLLEKLMNAEVHKDDDIVGMPSDMTEQSHAGDLLRNHQTNRDDVVVPDDPVSADNQSQLQLSQVSPPVSAGPAHAAEHSSGMNFHRGPVPAVTIGLKLSEAAAVSSAPGSQQQPAGQPAAVSSSVTGPDGNGAWSGTLAGFLGGEENTQDYNGTGKQREGVDGPEGALDGQVADVHDLGAPVEGVTSPSAGGASQQTADLRLRQSLPGASVPQGPGTFYHFVNSPMSPQDGSNCTFDPMSEVPPGAPTSPGGLPSPGGTLPPPPEALPSLGGSPPQPPEALPPPPEVLPSSAVCPPCRCTCPLPEEVRAVPLL